MSSTHPRRLLLRTLFNRPDDYKIPIKQITKTMGSLPKAPTKQPRTLRRLPDLHCSKFSTTLNPKQQPRALSFLEPRRKMPIPTNKRNRTEDTFHDVGLRIRHSQHEERASRKPNDSRPNPTRFTRRRRRRQRPRRETDASRRIRDGVPAGICDRGPTPIFSTKTSSPQLDHTSELCLSIIQ